MSISPIAAELYAILLASDEAVAEEQIKKHFGRRYEKDPNLFAGAINELSSAHRIQFFKQGNSLLYKAIHEETAVKFDGLR